MHPAISVIFFTVTSGAGFGFMAWLGLGMAMHEGPLAAFLTAGVAGVLAIVGLLASTFHLGHPERAWRAFSQWKSSWLSREGVAAVVTLSLFGIYSLIWMITGDRINWLGYLVTFGSVTTVYTTSMIYAQLKTVPQWNHSLTPLCYLGFSAASGLLLVVTFGAGEQLFNFNLVLLAALLLVFAWLLKMVWWMRAGKAVAPAGNSSRETATGLGFIGKVSLLEKPHSGENYLTREMVHKIGRKHGYKLKVIALLFGLIIPVLLCLLAYLTGSGPGLVGIAFCFYLAGLLVERWLFFAEATHVVSLYY